MQKQVWEYITKYDLIRSGEYIVVAVSGGPDSVALLHIMNSLARRNGFKIHAAHLNHGLRDEAGSDEQFVIDLCREWGIDITSHKIDVGMLAKSKKKSVEEAGREERYRFMQNLCGQIGADKIATAHHRRDQAETVLMHLLQGTGAQGLQGMLPRRDMIIRPLLALKQEDITTYINDNNLPFRIDSTNFDKNYLRNRIRWQLLPLLESDFNPRIEDSLCRLAEVMGEENQHWENEINTKWEQIVDRNEDGQLTAQINELRMLPTALRRRFLHTLLNYAGANRVSGADVDRTGDLILRKGSGKKIRVSGGLWVSRSYDLLRLGWVKPGTDQEEFCYHVEVPGQTTIPELGIEIRTRLVQNKASGNRDVAYFDWDAMEKPLFIRSRRPGDRFMPEGLQGTKKLKDYLIDAKIPVEDRNKMGILASAQQIYWLIGYRKTDAGKVESNTARILEIKVQKAR